jgi:DnaJ-class molecular chaperone
MLKRMITTALLVFVMLVGAGAALAEKCWKCEGEGKIRDANILKWRRVTCTRCNGTGQITPAAPDKNKLKAGEAVCLKCEGRGKRRRMFNYVPCKECGGDGVVSTGRP